MAIKLPSRSYLTLKELAVRWECTENDLRDLIVSGNLKPSYIINHVAQKVRFRAETDDGGPYWLPVTTETYEDDEGRQRAKLYDTSGAYYLLHPEVTSALNCKFYLFSKDRDHVQGEEEQNICFMLSGVKEWELITLDKVFESGMVLLSEVARFEEQKVEVPLNEDSLKTRERNSLLTIIAALCKEAKVDYTKPAKAAAMIQSTAAIMGIAIGESTIEGHLKKIPDAIESRMK